MGVINFKLPQDENVEVSVDPDALPSAVIDRLMENVIRQYIIGRTSVAKVRYDAGMKAHEADPTVDKPDLPDYAAIAAGAKNDLLNNKMRKRGDGTARGPADPVEGLVTKAVCSDLFAARRKKDKSIKFGTITKEVSEAGGGLKYLQALAGDDADKLKKIETKYLKPARAMLGMNAKGEKAEEDTGELI